MGLTGLNHTNIRVTVLGKTRTSRYKFGVLGGIMGGTMLLSFGTITQHVINDGLLGVHYGDGSSYV